ncbi:hypothetical protein RMSM_01503 [Rhodopirellula maiorica SM1]|uniref:Uncharacterized protein n=1 Tax=Rhodopirellula maiorica SM1 TaxID=1265738 RepID=M5S5U8_9BACT|nr:hypothetical protein RMSM_01503 [Rhodopirellula maiorica SM1]
MKTQKPLENPSWRSTSSVAISKATCLKTFRDGTRVCVWEASPWIESLDGLSI